MKYYQLRRIGLPPSVDGIQNVFRIEHDTTLIGRGNSVDIFLDSNIRKGLISRAHAHIIKKKDSTEITYELLDTSLNGTYVNDIRIKGAHALQDGDVVAFGHLRGSLIEAGIKAPQKESEFLFKGNLSKHLNHNNITNQNISSVFMSPKSPEQVVLPGVVMKNSSSPMKKRTKIAKDSDSELKSLISSVTSKITSDAKENNDDNMEDSFDIDFNQNRSENNFPESPVPVKPFHPRDKLTLSNTLPYTLSPASQTSSDNDIRIDTSLNVKHIDNKKENSPKSKKENNVKKRVRKVLEEHDAGKKLKKNHLTTTDNKTEVETIENDIAITKCQNDEMYAFLESDSEHSEEITDSSSDSEFEPTPSKTKTTNSNKTTTQQTAKKSNTSKNIFNVDDTEKKEDKFAHDKCAAWDCKRPSGALKKILWVQCDDCDDWFHLSCSGLNAKDAKRKDTNFHCGC